MKHGLTIAGSDSGGGAGIQADLKTFSALGVYGMSVITSITAQNTQGVEAIETLSPSIVGKQIDSVFSDISVDVVKIGMVANKEIIEIIVKKIKKWQIEKIVIDPVMVSESGHNLLHPAASKVLIKELLPLGLVITPNLFEAEKILNRKIKTTAVMKEAAADIYELGPAGVLVKGGHLQGDAVDVFYNGDQFYDYRTSRIKCTNTHGTGCTYSSAIAAYLTREYDLPLAIEKAKNYITGAIKNAFDVGQGTGPVNHFFNFTFSDRS